MNENEVPVQRKRNTCERNKQRLGLGIELKRIKKVVIYVKSSYYLPYLISAVVTHAWFSMVVAATLQDMEALCAPAMLSREYSGSVTQISGCE